MAIEPFRFKKFEVRHGRSSMRVGTDAVLLGAWADVGLCCAKSSPAVLDIGCGCGLIALMVAQRCPSCHVLGIDIDSPSVAEATENALRSPFAGMVRFRQADVRSFAGDGASEKYDLILCNPPYYTEDTLPPEQRRSMARNAVHLSFSELLCSVRRLLAEEGIFSVIVPMQARDSFVGEALRNNLHIRRECRIQTVSSKVSKRVLLEFDIEGGKDAVVTSLVLQGSDGGRSAEYSLLCKDFYL